MPSLQLRLCGEIFYGGKHPLATLGWPQSGPEARNMKRYPLDYLQCPDCSHVWNHMFSYDAIPYDSNPNRMYNRGNNWQGHLAKTRDLILSALPEDCTVVDVGCREGPLRSWSCRDLYRERSVSGFDPNSSDEAGVGIEFQSRLYDPITDTQNKARCGYHSTRT